ncbi:HTH-type transcriptional regulator LeuO [mine drainage metagenome]|uniref:HTH-type transcriptional regulator LeuO n=1 Tax=mine drainage metagenome TaxID=410659 RepID=A0A1J5QZF5_9ZZZZ
MCRRSAAAAQRVRFRATSGLNGRFLRSQWRPKARLADSRRPISMIDADSWIDQRLPKAPHSFISMIHCTYINISELLHNNEIDCAVISSKPEDERLSAKPLFRDDFVVISRADHLIVSKGMTLDSYLAADHVLVSHAGKRDGWVDERLMEIGKQRRIIATVHLFAAALPIIAEQNALCTLPRRLAMHFAKNHDLHISEVPLQHQARMFYLVWSQNQSANPAARWFRGQIELICKAIH